MAQDNTMLTAQERETRAAYFREWRARNKEKVKVYNQRYWQKKTAQRKNNESEVNNGTIPENP